MKEVFFRLIYILSGATVLSSCAGPMNPFGSDTLNILNFNKLSQEQIRLETSRSLASLDKDIEISFYPNRQNWHSGHDIYIIIQSKEKRQEISSNNLRVFWDKKNVSQSVNWAKDTVHESKYSLVFKIKNVRLLPNKSNDISVYYIRPKDHHITAANYKKPMCDIHSTDSINNTSPFNVKSSFLKMVAKTSSKKGINPSFMTALIAQESGFNTKAVSYAKAIGLTQVTELANKHIRRKYHKWKSDKRIKTLPVPVIRALIQIGKIDKRNDWRLDKQKSVLGGIEYIKYLNKYWQGNIGLLDRIYGEQNNHAQIISELMIASYNSGAFRVKTALMRKGVNWQHANNLKEARKYLGKVKSYCYHFSNEQGANYEKQASNF